MESAASTPKQPATARKKRVVVGIVTGATVVLVAFAAFQFASPPAPAACTPPSGVFTDFRAPEGGARISDAQFLTADGAERRLSDYKGQGIVLNFWATWCAPCVREMPELDRLKAMVEKDKIAVLAVSEDRKGMEVAPKFYMKNNLENLDILVDKAGGLLRSLGVSGLPTTILFDGEGYEKGRVFGIAPWDSEEIVGFLRSCLARGD